MNLLAPKLKIGDKIGIVAPSNPLNIESKRKLNKFKGYLEDCGFKIKLSKNIFKIDQFNSSAGSPEKRANDINTMFKDPKIKAIWCFQGGETANQTLDLLDFNLIGKNPKIFLGKSDIDVLSLAIHKITGLVTFHGCDAKIGDGREMDFDYTKKWFIERIINCAKAIEPKSRWITIREGMAEGKLLGCNQTSILKLVGTKYFPDFKESILFLETYKTKVKHLLFQIEQMNQIGVFQKIKAMVVGNNYRFEGEKNNLFVKDIIKELTSKYQFPILKINEFGHYQPHAFLPIGARVLVDATNKKIEILDNFLN